MYPKKIFNGHLPEGGPKLGLLFRQKEILFKISWICRKSFIDQRWMDVGLRCSVQKDLANIQQSYVSFILPAWSINSTLTESEVIKGKSQIEALMY